MKMKHLVNRHRWLIPVAFLALLLLIKPLYAQDSGGMPPGNATSAAVLPNGWTVIDQDADGYTKWRLEVNSACSFDDHKYMLNLPEEPARMADIRLTMSNYDVDYFDPQDCEGGPEFDNADINGAPLGILAGANDSWSVNSWRLDRSVLVKGNNKIFIDTDASGTGCWCVAVGYIELQAKVGFQITEMTPTDGEQNRDFHAGKLDLTVTFSSDLDATTVNDNTFVLGYRNPAGQMQPVAGSFTLVAPNKFRFEPNADLIDGVRYYVTVIGGPNGVKSAAGVELAATRTSSFWTVPNLDLTDSFDIGDGAGSRCKPTAAPCKGLEIAVFQVARNAIMVPNKDAVARIYVRWKRHGEVHKDDQVTSMNVSVQMDVTPGSGSYAATQVVKRPGTYTDAEIHAGNNSINIFHKPAVGFNYSVQVTPQPQSNATVVVYNATQTLPNAGRSPTISFDHYFLKDGEWLSGVPSGVRTGALNFLLNGAQLTLDMFPAVAVNAVDRGDLTIGYTYTGATTTDTACGAVKKVMCPVGGTMVERTEFQCVIQKMQALVGSKRFIAITAPQSVCPNVGGVRVGSVLMLPPSDNPVVIPHEVGHAYEISPANNPNNGHRNSPDGIEGYQVRTRTNRSRAENPDQTLSLMHTGPDVTPAAQWIHNDDYAALFNTVTLAQSASTNAGPYLVVSGLVDVEGSSAQLDPLFWQDEAAEPPASGVCSATLLDASSNPLATVAFAPAAEIYGWDQSGVEQDLSPQGIEATGPQPFALTLPWNENAQSLQISCNSTPLATVNRSAALPTVDFSDLANGAILSHTVTINWSGSDGDGGDLFYQLQFSEDGTAWTPLSPVVAATSQAIDTTSLPSGSGRKVRLLVTDGFNSAYAERNVTVDNPLAVVAQDPPDFAEQIGLNASMQAMFNTPIDPASLSFATFSVDGGSTPPTGTLTLSAGGRVVTFQPSTPLDPLSYYTVRVHETLKDVSGRTLPFATVWSFRTISDTTPPLIEAITPAEGASHVPLNDFIAIHFSEELDFGSTINSITVVDGANQTVAGSTSYYDRDSNLVFIPEEKLAANTTYKVTVPATVKDENGNALETARVWSFTTGETEGDRARIVGNYDEVASDLDGDGLYDTLTVYVDVLTLGAQYNLNARLLDKSGELIQWTKAEFGDTLFVGLVDQGLHRLALTFDGRVIRAHQTDGPYFIDSLNFYNLFAPLNGDTRFEVFQTLPYDVDSFAGILSFLPLPDRLLEWNTTRENAWNLRDYTISLADPVASVTYRLIGNSDPRVAVSIDAENFIDIHPTPNIEAESVITVEARDTLGNVDTGTFIVRVQKPVATFLLVPAELALKPNAETTIDVEIQDQFEHLYSGEAVTVTFANDLETATVTPEEVASSNGHAAATYKAGAEMGTDTVYVTSRGGLLAQVNIVIAAESIRLPGVKNGR